jgi:DUF971 family protein
MLVIDWEDQIRQHFPWPFLRSKCPSATEKAARESAAANPLSVLSAVPSSNLVEVRAIGHYAIGLVWADGHAYGIYTWDYLRQIATADAVVKESIDSQKQG